jgi:hypothetical protein
MAGVETPAIVAELGKAGLSGYARLSVLRRHQSI